MELVDLIRIRDRRLFQYTSSRGITPSDDVEHQNCPEKPFAGRHCCLCDANHRSHSKAAMGWKTRSKAKPQSWHTKKQLTERPPDARRDDRTDTRSSVVQTPICLSTSSMSVQRWPAAAAPPRAPRHPFAVSDSSPSLFLVVEMLNTYFNDSCDLSQTAHSSA